MSKNKSKQPNLTPPSLGLDSSTRARRTSVGSPTNLIIVCTNSWIKTKVLATPGEYDKAGGRETCCITCYKGLREFQRSSSDSDTTQLRRHTLKNSLGLLQYLCANAGPHHLSENLQKSTGDLVLKNNLPISSTKS